MVKQGNILSFDEARARGAVRSRHASTRSIPEQHHRSAYQKHASEQQQRVNRYSRNSLHEQAYPTHAQRGRHSSISRQQQHAHRSAYAQPPYSSRYDLTHTHDVNSDHEELHDARRAVRPEESTRNKKKGLSHRIKSAKAERQFNKTFGAEEARNSAPEQTSRAAVYEMKMGRSHKKSSRALNEGRAGRSSRRGGFGSFLSMLDPRSSRLGSALAITCVMFVLAVGLLYQPVAKFYNEVRMHQQLEAEYAVVSEYYSNLKSEVDYLNTQEGMEDYVRDELGWVKPGERVVQVNGLKQRDLSARKGSITSDLSGAVPTPRTWYSDVLDVVFGYNKL